MRSTEFQAFAETWAFAWEQVGKAITPGAIELAFEALRDYQLADIRRALTVHLRDPQRGRFAPTVSDISAVLEPVNGQAWPSSDEAWSICVRTFDESDTVVVTDEIMRAREAAQPIMDIGDEVGARMAFRDTYDRLVGAAKFSGTPPRWWVTHGSDPNLRRQRITEAVELRRLPRSALDALPGTQASISDTIRVLEHVVKTDPDRRDQAEKARGMLASLKDILATKSAADDAALRERKALERQADEDKRKAALARANALLDQGAADGTNG